MKLTLEHYGPFVYVNYKPSASAPDQPSVVPLNRMWFQKQTDCVLEPEDMLRIARKQIQMHVRPVSDLKLEITLDEGGPAMVRIDAASEANANNFLNDLRLAGVFTSGSVNSIISRQALSVKREAIPQVLQLFGEAIRAPGLSLEELARPMQKLLMAERFPIHAHVKVSEEGTRLKIENRLTVPIKALQEGRSNGCVVWVAPSYRDEVLSRFPGDRAPFPLAIHPDGSTRHASEAQTPAPLGFKEPLSKVIEELAAPHEGKPPLLSHDEAAFYRSLVAEQGLASMAKKAADKLEIK